MTHTSSSIYLSITYNSKAFTCQVLLPSCCILRFLIVLQRTTCRRKPWRFPQISVGCSAYLLGSLTIGDYVAEKFPLAAIPYGNFPVRFAMLDVVFHLFLWAFLMFSLVFLPVFYLRSYLCYKTSVNHEMQKYVQYKNSQNTR